jgi:hypothetical protein
MATAIYEDNQIFNIPLYTALNYDTKTCVKLCWLIYKVGTWDFKLILTLFIPRATV